MPEIPQFISSERTPVGIAPTVNPQGALATQHELNRAENALLNEAAYQNRVSAHLLAVQDTAVRNGIVENAKLKFQNDLAQLEQTNLEQYGGSRPDLYRDQTFRGAVDLVKTYADLHGGNDTALKAGLTKELSEFARGRLGSVNTQTSALIAKQETDTLEERAASSITGIAEAAMQGNQGMAEYHMKQYAQALNLTVGMNDAAKVTHLRTFQSKMTEAVYLQEVARGNGAAVLTELMGTASAKEGRTTDGRKIINLPDGSIETEKTITVTEPRINGGKPTNIPTIYNGKHVSDEEAIRIIEKNGGIDPDTGRKLEGFNSIKEAVTAAKSRSAELESKYNPVLSGLPAMSYISPDNMPPEKRIELINKVTAMLDHQQKQEDKAGKLAAEQTEFQVRVKAMDPVNPLTSTQTLDLVTPLIGKGLTAEQGMKLVQDVRNIEQKDAPENVRHYNEKKSLIEADPNAISRNEIIGDGVLNPIRTRELLALKDKVTKDRAKADYYTNQPAYKDVEQQMRADYQISLMGIPTKEYSTAIRRLNELVDPQGDFKLQPWEAYKRVTTVEAPPMMKHDRLRMLDDRIDALIPQYDAGKLSIQELKTQAVKMGITPLEAAKLKSIIDAIDATAIKQGYRDINAVKPKSK